MTKDIAIRNTISRVLENYFELLHGHRGRIEAVHESIHEFSS